MEDIAIALTTAISTVAGFGLIRLGFLILRGNRTAYEANRQRTGGLRRLVSGRIPPGPPGDSHVRAGIAIDTCTNAWVPAGRLSDDALRQVLRS